MGGSFSFERKGSGAVRYSYIGSRDVNEGATYN